LSESLFRRFLRDEREILKKAAVFFAKEDGTR